MKTFALFMFVASTSLIGCTPKETPSSCDGNCHPAVVSSASTDDEVTGTPVPSGSTTLVTRTSAATQSASVPSTTSSYTAGSVILTASSAWEETVPPVSHVTLQLVNKSQGLSFAVVSTTTKLTSKDYIQSGVSEFQALGMTTTTGTTTVNGVSYTTLTSSSSTQSSQQWVQVDGSTVRVFTCNGQKFDTSDVDACQAVMNTVRSR